MRRNGRAGVDRREFVGLLGSVSLVGVAGCVGGDEEPPDDGADDAGSDTESESGTDSTEAFDFPAGADGSKAISETVVSGARDVVAKAPRYRIEQDHELAYRGGETITTEITYDVGEEAVQERRLRPVAEIDRWVTPERTVARSAEVDGGRSSRWVAETTYPGADSARGFHLYPFEETTVPEFLESASLEFDEIVTEGDRSYARYAGEIAFPGAIEAREVNGARHTHEIESATDGRVAVLLAESGAIRSVEYEVAGDVARITPDSREVASADVSGEIRLEYDDSGDLEAPEWAEADGEFIDFTVREVSTGEVYEMTRGSTLPGSSEREYARFFVTAQFGERTFVDHFSQPNEFEVGDRLYVGLSDDEELTLNGSSLSGRNALEVADRIELSVYLWAPGESYAPIYHEILYS